MSELESLGVSKIETDEIIVEIMIYFHEENIIYCDLKLSNCLLFSDEDMNVN